MTIYTSEKVMPYVYMGIHKTTGQFYIGSRCNKQQTLPSHIDLFKYRTSSKRVKPIFDEFDWIILAEFVDGHSAYDFEQYLIYENWGDQLLLNRVCHHNKARWNTHGCTREHTDSSKAKMSISRSGCKNHMFGKHHTPETKAKISSARRGKPGHKHTNEYKENMSKMMLGHTVSAETRAKISATAKSRGKLQNKKPRKDAKHWLVTMPSGESINTNNLQKLITEQFGFTLDVYKRLLHFSRKNTPVTCGPLIGWLVSRV